MKLIEIKTFIKELEQTIASLGFSYTEIEGNYLAKYGAKEVLMVPYFDNIDLEIPTGYFYKNIIVVSSNNNNCNTLENKTFSLLKLKKLSSSREKIGEKTYNQIINTLFFGGKLCDVIDLLIDVFLKEDKNIQTSKNTKKSKSTDLFTSDGIENKIDISVLESKLSIRLEKRKKHYANDKYGVVAIISKFYQDKGNYWYGYHDYQIELLTNYNNPYIAFYFKDRRDVLFVPLAFMEKYRSKLNSTTNPAGTYWHIYIRFQDEKCLWQIPNNGLIDVSQYLIKTEKDIPINVLDTNIEFSENNNLSNCPSGTTIKIKSKSFHETKVKK